MFISRHQMTACLPRADNINGGPGRIDNERPYKVIHSRWPLGAGTNNTAPGGDSGLGFQLSHILNGKSGTAQVTNNVIGKDKGGTGKQQEH